MNTPQFTTASLTQLTSGRLIGADVEFTSVSTDSRTLSKGALFVALHGPNFDGHEYIQTAIARGASAALVSREVNVALPQVLVPEVLAGLSQFACTWRRQFSFPVIGVTGSNGKTTAKEMLGSILAQRGACLVTRGNLNNHIGVPLTLLRLNATHQSAVIEMGANHRREIAALTALAEPDIGLVTNAGAAHLEGFGGLEGVAQGKGELYLALPPTGTAIINADDRYADYWRAHCATKNMISFGIEHPADFTARNIVAHHTAQGAQTSFELHAPQGVITVNLQLVGTHNVRNALGAAAAATAAGATLGDIQAGLNAMRPVGGRLQTKAAIHGAALIDDSYNANPSSVQAGLDALQNLGGRRWLIFGDMLELGPDAARLHADMGAYARSTGIERLLAVGEYTPHTVAAFGEGAEWFASLDALIAVAQRAITPNVTVLIKGSRGNRLERVAAALALNTETADATH